MSLFSYVVMFVSVLLFIQSTFSLFLMLYSWEISREASIDSSPEFLSGTSLFIFGLAARTS